MRHAAYRQYVMWQHGHLGLGRLIIIHCVLSELFVAYTHNLLQLTQNLFHPENSQWINKGQLQVSVWIHLKFLSFAPPKLWALRKFLFLTDGTWTWIRFFFFFSFGTPKESECHKPFEIQKFKVVTCSQPRISAILHIPLITMHQRNYFALHPSGTEGLITRKQTFW